MRAGGGQVQPLAIVSILHGYVVSSHTSRFVMVCGVDVSFSAACYALLNLVTLANAMAKNGNARPSSSCTMSNSPSLL